jgi:leader peptidase (prepilin peptidase) / N-methyltransferase
MAAERRVRPTGEVAVAGGEPCVRRAADAAVARAPAISLRAPAARPWTLSPAAVVAALAVAAVALARIGLTPYGVMAAGSLGVLVVLSAIDVQARILPNVIVLPATAAVFAAQAVFYPGALTESVVAALVAASVTLAPALVNPAAMGMGDVKLAAFLGMLLGSKVLAAMMLGFLATAPVLVVLLITRGRSARRKAVPLGPFLALGAAVVLLA